LNENVNIYLFCKIYDLLFVIIFNVIPDLSSNFIRFSLTVAQNEHVLILIHE